ncbi:MAG: FAD-binding and (Fe-S)-binding domain-containing protein [Myxococcales bacterium]|nr:FAD-binding protein [Myxococcales bacterium]
MDLERALKERIEGEVRFDKGSRALYATDGSNYRQVPIGVVIPRSVEDVVETVRLAREFGAPIVPRGGGTSLAGQCCNVAVVIDFSKYLNRILQLDYDGRTAWVEPGVVLDRLRDDAEKRHLTFAPDPSTHNHCTLGGMIGNNSCGVHSVMAGKTEENVEELDILLYDGTRMRVGAGGGGHPIYRKLSDLRDRYIDQIRSRFPRIPRRVSGYNLPELLPENGFNVARALVGTEGTCALVLAAKVRLVHSPPCRSLLVLGYDSVYESADHIPEVMEAGPTGCEGIDDKLVEEMKIKGIHPDDVTLLPEGNGWLLVEFGGETKEESDGKAHALMQKLRGKCTMKLFDDKHAEEQLWKVRESGLGATARTETGVENWEGWEDSAVAPENLGRYLRELRKLYDRYDYDGALYGHFGQGCVHTRINFDLRDAEGIRKFRNFLHEAARLVVSLGGSISGEHGDGQSKAELLPIMYGEDLIHAFAEFKSIWDPDWKMNPGKKVRPFRADENLRIGTHYRPPALPTIFNYADDDFSFAKATVRCVGIGECRKEEKGTMCPSYMVTREEQHSTRGRAHLLFEMLQGNPLDGGWRSPAVKEALDLCLACKGCKGECPVNVDMATYKAEFLAHYYKGRLRPRAAYAMGLIHWSARVASRMPRLANAVGALLKPLAGIARQRRLPKFATQTFRDWFDRRPRPGKGERVILWADTFNNFFHPEILKAAVEVLEDAGCDVIVQGEKLCCGRPLYDYGMLDLARSKLRQILDDLRDEIERGTPVVGLEPSCISVFRDELRGIFPHDADAQRLRRQTFLLSEFLVDRKWKPPPLHRKAIVHGHCHHKAVLGWKKEVELLKQVLPEHEIVDSGCCGMAGSFGYEADKYEISMQVGERRLLPKVRDAPKDTLIVADGFSCHGQIETADRKPVHIAQVLQMALREKRAEPRESRIATRRLRTRRVLKVAALAGAVAFAVTRI